MTRTSGETLAFVAFGAFAFVLLSPILLLCVIACMGGLSAPLCGFAAALAYERGPKLLGGALFLAGLLLNPVGALIGGALSIVASRLLLK